MGYRSDVQCIIYGSPEILDSFITKHTLKNNLFLSEMKNCIAYGLTDRVHYTANGLKEEHKNKIMNFQASGYKWYDEYHEVQALNSLLDDIDKNYEDALDFEYIRVGEDQKDIETKYSQNAYGYLSTSTIIVADLNMEDIPNEKD